MMNMTLIRLEAEIASVEDRLLFLKSLRDMAISCQGPEEARAENQAKNEDAAAEEEVPQDKKTDTAPAESRWSKQVSALDERVGDELEEAIKAGMNHKAIVQVFKTSYPILGEWCRRRGFLRTDNGWLVDGIVVPFKGETGDDQSQEPDLSKEPAEICEAPRVESEKGEPAGEPADNTDPLIRQFELLDREIVGNMLAKGWSPKRIAAVRRNKLTEEGVESWVKIKRRMTWNSRLLRWEAIK